MKDFEHDKPENWIWGIVYFNKLDTRLIVRKRHAVMGWTFNFGHPVSYVVLVLILLIAIIGSRLSTIR